MPNAPKPTHLKLLQGNPGKRPINDKEPQPEKKIRVPTAPQHLNAVAKKHWRKTAKQLHECGLLTGIDEIALSMYCDAYAKWVDAKDNIEKYGAVVKTKNGFPVQSPYFAIANKAFDQMKGMLTEFGMTPSSRSKVTVDKPGEGDGMDDFLGRR